MVTITALKCPQCGCVLDAKRIKPITSCYYCHAVLVIDGMPAEIDVPVVEPSVITDQPAGAYTIREIPKLRSNNLYGIAIFLLFAAIGTAAQMITNSEPQITGCFTAPGLILAIYLPYRRYKKWVRANLAASE